MTGESNPSRDQLARFLEHHGFELADWQCQYLEAMAAGECALEHLLRQIEETASAAAPSDPQRGFLQRWLDRIQGGGR